MVRQALHWAAYRGDPETTQLLIRAGGCGRGRESLRCNPTHVGMHEGGSVRRGGVVEGGG